MSDRVSYELDLDSLAFGGDAVGRHDGKVVFVPGGVPGDRVRVVVRERRASYERAEIVELLKSSPARREVACPHAAACGGCPWMQVAYPQQLEAKREVVASALRGLPVRALEVIGAPQELGYRGRARLHWDVRAGRVRVGYHRRGTQQLLDIDRCSQLEPLLDRVQRQMRGWLAEVREGAGSLVLLAGSAGQAHVSVRFARGRRPSVAVPLGDDIAGVVVRGNRGRSHRTGASTIELERGGMRVSAEVFAQANRSQNGPLLERVGAEAAVTPGTRVLELFAGSGNLTRVLAVAGAEVLAVESARVAARLLKRNVAQVETWDDDAARAVDRLVHAGRTFDLVVLDPPREGAATVAKRLGALGAPRVVYVSCDPMTLARDLRLLVEQGYGELRVQGIDMMPQTFHMELVVTAALPPHGPQDKTAG